MKDIKKEVLELVEEIEAGKNEYVNVHKIITILNEAIRTNKVDKEFVMEIDNRLGLEYFN